MLVITPQFHSSAALLCSLLYTLCRGAIRWLYRGNIIGEIGSSRSLFFCVVTRTRKLVSLSRHFNQCFVFDIEHWDKLSRRGKVVCIIVAMFESLRGRYIDAWFREFWHRDLTSAVDCFSAQHGPYEKSQNHDNLWPVLIVIISNSSHKWDSQIWIES